MIRRYAKLEGKKVVIMNDLTEPQQLFETDEARRVAKTEISKDVMVSTVFLGINHGYAPGLDLWFETMVFGGEFDEEMNRYETWEEAIKGHQEMVERVKK